MNLFRLCKIPIKLAETLETLDQSRLELLYSTYSTRLLCASLDKLFDRTPGKGEFPVKHTTARYEVARLVPSLNRKYRT